MFEGKYRIVRELGRGGFGMVYLAHQEQMDRHVALKVLRSGLGRLHRSAKERFLREVRIISKLRHPNTVTIHDFGETAEGVLYMVLEYIEGRTVKQILKQEGAQDPIWALALARQIARSLAEAHRHGVIHRDLKPANIMVMDLEGEADFVKVLDFGVARLLRTDERDLTSAGLPEGERELIGTPRYMSPEQVRGEELGPASDVYSLGLILYEMLIGEPAVQGDTTMALISQQISAEPLRLTGLRGLPPRVSELLRRATAKNLQQRFSDSEEFTQFLEQALISVGGDIRQSGSFSAIDASGQIGRAGASGQFGAMAPPGPERDAQDQTDPWFGSSAGGPSAPGHDATQGALPQHQPRSRQPSRPHASAQANAGAQQDGGSRRSGPQAVFGASFDSNQVDARQDEFGGDLPPPPSEENNPFAVEEPTPDPRESSKQRDKQEGSSVFVLQFLRLAVFGIVAAVGLYLAFMISGTIFGQFLSGDLKIVAALILAFAIPLLTALGENSKKERFEVVDDAYDRVVRIFVGTAIFSFGTAVLCALAMSGTVVHELRTFPNWYLTDAQRQGSFGDFNEKVSLGVAKVIEEGTTAIGIYSGIPHADVAQKPVAPVVNEPPAPTRPSTQAKQGGDEQAGDSAEAKQPRPRTTPRPTRPSNTPQPTRPTNPRANEGESKSEASDSKQDQGSSKEDGEYIRW